MSDITELHSSGFVTFSETCLHLARTKEIDRRESFLPACGRDLFVFTCAPPRVRAIASPVGGRDFERIYPSSICLNQKESISSDSERLLFLILLWSYCVE